MNDIPKFPLRIGAWRLDPRSGQLSRDDESLRLEARTLRLLLYLVARAGEVVGIEELLDRVWTGVIVTPDSVYQAVASLRRTLKDDPKQSAYIATVPRLGYRLVAPVSPCSEDAELSAASSVATPTVPASIENSDAAPETRRPLRWFAAGAAVLLLAAAVYGFAGRERSGHGVARSGTHAIGVVPFLDLTEGMQEESFADGMTEELIDKLSKLPGFKVPTPTAVFFFKDKQVAPVEIGRALGVTYLLDGSVRKSGNRVRVAARLVRADDAFVLWSETYERPFDDLLQVQDDIATEVRAALPASLDNAADGKESTR